MVGENETGAAAPAVDANAAKAAPKQRKPRAGGRQKKAAVPAKAAKAAPARRTARYSHDERAEKLGLIEGLLARGKSTLKDAVKKAGITEQTYYHWKKASGKAGKGDGLKDLVKLEEENQRLRKLLAEKLRAENAELRQRLGVK